MPTYEYRCENGHTFEVVQRMTDDPVTSCEECGAPVERVFHPIAIAFKGSGFYNTDYKAKTKAKVGASDEGGGEGSTSSKDSDSKATESKSEKKKPEKNQPKKDP